MVHRKRRMVMQGKLYLCATPIGNLEDITYRVVRTLGEVDLIAAEDTRNSIKLLNHFAIKTPMTSYHEHNKMAKGEVLVQRLLAGESIALITDAGTPGISDPGEELVKMCYDAGIEVTSLPGAVACITALTISGLPTRRFAFEAFLPSDKKERKVILAELKDETRTIILYEAPHRLLKTLSELLENLGERQASVCRELTKRYETVVRLPLSQMQEYYETNPVKGECVIVIEGLSHEAIALEKQQEWLKVSVEEHLQEYLEKGFDKREAIKMVAKDRNVSKREIYNQVNAN